MDLLGDKAASGAEVINEVEPKPSVDTTTVTLEAGVKDGGAEIPQKEKLTDDDEGQAINEEAMINDELLQQDLQDTQEEQQEDDSSSDDGGGQFYAMHFKPDGSTMREGEGMPSSTMLQLLLAVEMMAQRRYVEQAASAAASASSSNDAPGLPLPRRRPKYPAPPSKKNKKR